MLNRVTSSVEIISARWSDGTIGGMFAKGIVPLTPVDANTVVVDRTVDDCLEDLRCEPDSSGRSTRPFKLADQAAKDSIVCLWFVS
jgi:hypothetical protein